MSHYIRFTIPKRSGGTRTLATPHRTLAEAQRWIFAQIVSKLPVEAPAHGFIAGRSILTNAREHANRAIVVNLDLEDFFPSIGFPRVRSVFKRAGYSPAGGDDPGAFVHRVPAAGHGVRRREVFRGDRPTRVAARCVYQPGPIEPGGQEARPPSGWARRQAGHLVTPGTPMT